MAHEITPAITYPFNKSLELGRVPKDWLDAHIVPVFKKDEKIHHHFTGQFHSPVTSVHVHIYSITHGTLATILSNR
jgi:hypothetical protein